MKSLWFAGSLIALGRGDTQDTLKQDRIDGIGEPEYAMPPVATMVCNEVLVTVIAVIGFIALVDMVILVWRLEARSRQLFDESGGDEPETETVCVHCRQEIEPGAKRCQHCGSYQGLLGKSLQNWQLGAAIAFAVTFITVQSWEPVSKIVRPRVKATMVWVSMHDVSNLAVAIQNVGRSAVLVVDVVTLSISYDKEGVSNADAVTTNMVPSTGDDVVLDVDEISGFSLKIPDPDLERWRNLPIALPESRQRSPQGGGLLDGLYCSITFLVRDANPPKEGPDEDTPSFIDFDSEILPCPHIPDGADGT